MRIAIFGATGSVGSALLVHLMKGTCLHPGDEVILVGRGDPDNTARLLAIQTDLMDAFDAGIVGISVCAAMEDLTSVDVFVMAAGQTLSASITRREDLAEANLSLFKNTASSLARTSPNCIVLIVSNPVELAVNVFANRMDRTRVFGMGAQQDSIRFARAIATHLHLPRGYVRASVIGEHGPGMLPLWSSVRLTHTDLRDEAELAKLRSHFDVAEADQLPATIKNAVSEQLSPELVQKTYQWLAISSPEVRIKIEPLLTRRLLHSTPNATANATMECLQALIDADDRKVHGQVFLRGEFGNIQGVFGVPLALRSDGWRLNSYDDLSDEEQARALKISQKINRDYESLLP
jgi:malate dehydrogenase